MRIALIGGVTVPMHGGIESYMFELAKAMTARGHFLWIICMGKESKEFTLDGVKISHVKTLNGFLGLYIFLEKATKMVIECPDKFDVINYHRFYFTKWLTRDTKKHGITTCFTNHSFAIDNPKHGKVAKLVLKFLNYFAFWGINNCITVSNYGAKLLKSRFGKESFVLHGGVVISTNNNESAILDTINLKNQKYFLTICRIDPVKGLEALVDAFKKHPKSDDIYLVIGGDCESQYAKSIILRAKDDDRIIFVGTVYGLDKITLLSNTLAYCLVSSSEGFPISLLEAMAYGKACIASNIPANIELLTQENGFWCTTGDSNSIYQQMKQIEKEEDKRIEIGNKNKERVNNYFSWSIIAQQFEYYLKSILI